jgi:hypothetical protein
MNLASETKTVSRSESRVGRRTLPVAVVMKPTPKGPMKLDDLSVILRQTENRVSGVEFDKCCNTHCLRIQSCKWMKSEPRVSLLCAL